MRLFRQNGNAVPRSLALPHGEIARFEKIGLEKVTRFTFQFLKANDVRLALPQPLQEVWQALVDVVDVEGFLCGLAFGRRILFDLDRTVR